MCFLGNIKTSGIIGNSLCVYKYPTYLNLIGPIFFPVCVFVCWIQKILGAAAKAEHSPRLLCV